MVKPLSAQAEGLRVLSRLRDDHVEAKVAGRHADLPESWAPIRPAEAHGLEPPGAVRHRTRQNSSQS
jgi:hypothetical protein